jgi:hypothetical protein
MGSVYEACAEGTLASVILVIAVDGKRSDSQLHQIILVEGVSTSGYPCATV